MVLLRRFIFTACLFSSILFVGCDSFDSILEPISGIFSSKEEKDLKAVIKAQNDTSEIITDLFKSGMDTLSVIDSIYNFFLNNDEVEFVVADSQVVAVDYKNVVGGVLLVYYNCLSL